jgi:dTDP-D-glucose 4,6-dehydratase
MVRCYNRLIVAPTAAIAGQTFNVGAKNYTIAELALIVKEVVEQEIPGPEIRIVTEPSIDTRSYQVNSDKIKKYLDFEPLYTVSDAIRQLCAAFTDGRIPHPLSDDRYYNVKWMRLIWEEVYKNAPPSSFDPTKGHLSEIDVMHR